MQVRALATQAFVLMQSRGKGARVTVTWMAAWLQAAMSLLVAATGSAGDSIYVQVLRTSEVIAQ